MKKIVKIIIIIVVLAVLAVLGASFFSDTSSSQNQTTGLRSTTTGQTANPITTPSASSQDSDSLNREFLAILLNLESINLNDDIFSEPAFSALVDNTVRLNQPGNEGRPNPFAPIGIDTQTTVPLTASVSSVSQPVEAEQTATTAEQNGVDTEQMETETSSEEDLSSLGGS